MNRQNKQLSPDFIGIGAPKSGTTWLAKCLNEHPDICMPEEELDFFNKDHGYGSVETEWYYKRGIGWYYTHFEHCAEDKLIGEFSPKYLFDSEAPTLIHKYFPSAKLIVVLRDPIDRTYSLFKHIKSKRPDALGTLEKTTENDPAFLEASKYYHQLKRYFDLFPREQIGVFFYEDLAENPQAFVQGVYEFLDVDKAFTPPSVSIKLNTAEQRASKTHHKAYSTLFKITRALKRNPIGRFMVSVVKKLKLHILVFKLIDTLTIQRAPKKQAGADPQTRTRLKELFAEDIKKTEGLLGYKIAQWH